MKKNIIIIVLIVCANFFSSGCTHISTTRIGPPLDPKPQDCEIEILAPGNAPLRPYRDVAVISLRNCQEYQSGPCKMQLTKEACSLGGDVAYVQSYDISNDGRPDSLAGDVTHKLVIATYIASLRPAKDDPVLNATPAAPCDDSVKDANESETPEDQMCVE